MKKFNIEVVSKKPKKIYGLPSYKGCITIGEFKETFVMPLNSWTIDEYKQQWKEGLERIKTHNISCLVVTVQNLDMNPLIELWSLYKENNTIYIQNHLLNRLIMEVLTLPLKLSEFNIKTCYQFVTPRETLTEDGEKISEWHVDIQDI